MWAQAICALLGLWLTLAPDVLAYGNPARTNDHLCGPLIVAIALIACWRPFRLLRFANVLIGLWLLAAPWFLLYQGMDLGVGSMLNDLAIGVALLFLAPIGSQNAVTATG